MAYQISGLWTEGRVEATQLMPSSAAVLAMKWVSAGATEVRITDNAGRTYDLPAFNRCLDRQSSWMKPF